jgi:hypothetical protein
MENFIYIKENVLSPDICNTFIAKFTESKRKIDNQIKSTSTKYKYNDDISKQFIELLTPELEYYIKTIYCSVTKYSSDKNVIAEHYEIKQLSKNTTQQYVNVSSNTVNGLVAFVIYLNTVENGTDTLLEHIHIEPTIGKLVLFPCDWMFPIIQESSTYNDKYVLVGTILSVD